MRATACAPSGRAAAVAWRARAPPCSPPAARSLPREAAAAAAGARGRGARHHDRPAARAQRLRAEEALPAAAGVPLGGDRPAGHLQAPRQLPADLHGDPRAPRRRGVLRQHERRDRPAQGRGRDPGAAGGPQRRLDVHRGASSPKDGSGITADPKTWKGKRVALVNKVTTAGYLYPLSLLRHSGYQGDPERYFKQMTFTGSHDAAILAVFNGEADFGACKNTVFEEYMPAAPRDPARRSPCSTSPPQVPSNGLGVRPDLDPRAQAKLREALLGMHATRGRTARAAAVPGPALRRDRPAATTTRCSRWPARPASTSPPGRCATCTDADAP